jgi:hypothetical protein
MVHQLVYTYGVAWNTSSLGAYFSHAFPWFCSIGDSTRFGSEAVGSMRIFTIENSISVTYDPQLQLSLKKLIKTGGLNHVLLFSGTVCTVPFNGIGILIWRETSVKWRVYYQAVHYLHCSHFRRQSWSGLCNDVLPLCS